MDGETTCAVKAACLALAGLIFVCGPGRAEGYSFTNAMALAALAEQRGDSSAASQIYDAAQRVETNHVEHLCALARRFCDLACLTDSATVQNDIVQRALRCSVQAVNVASNNAAAHACLAVCYAKCCPYADIKAQLAYSRLFKLEAERAIALDPRQDIAYYLLGRWNYAMANVGLLSRAYVKMVYGGLPKASYLDAIVNFQKAIELAPNRIIHHAGLAMAFGAAGEKELEIRELKKCRSLTPSDREDQDARREAMKTLGALGQ
jgi:tetratricopeptide (TPR) repeat protein